MVTGFQVAERDKAARFGALVFALILLGLNLAAGQSTGKSSASTQKKGSTATTPAKAPTAVIHTTVGDMKCELFPDKAPKAVANFIGLAKGTKDWKNPETGKAVHGKPLYDGVIFHRVIPEFMIQTGDPTGTGSGDVGIQFSDELHPDLLFDQPGRLAMANAGPNTNSSQFFITEVPQPFLNPCFEPNGCFGGRRAPNTGYTIFGQCDADTVELVKRIARMPCQGGPNCSGQNSHPLNPVKVTHIDILGAGKSAPAKPAAKKSSAPVKPSAPSSSTPK
ncbi:MAG TPA: peptidylprolyl isomerase [Candidatus Angelobacter sp.]|nr:peptidylprolyl isomerase [Candidatus Angelobacter sp.]